MSNLRITQEKVKEVGACNFCRRAELGKLGLKYSYRKVFILKGDTSLSVNICEELLRRLK